MTLTIKKVCLSNNTCRYFPPNLNARLHWRLRSDWTKAFKEQVWGELHSHGNRAEAWQLMKNRIGKAEVRIIFYTCRFMDYDNAYGSAKPLLDALKNQVITNDSPEDLKFEVIQEKVDHLKDQKTEIIISA